MATLRGKGESDPIRLGQGPRGACPAHRVCKRPATAPSPTSRFRSTSTARVCRFRLGASVALYRMRCPGCRLCGQWCETL